MGIPFSLFALFGEKQREHIYGDDVERTSSLSVLDTVRPEDGGPRTTHYGKSGKRRGMGHCFSLRCKKVIFKITFLKSTAHDVAVAKVAALKTADDLVEWRHLQAVRHNHDSDGRHDVTHKIKNELHHSRYMLCKEVEVLQLFWK